jgi:hypothetical protein
MNEEDVRLALQLASRLAPNSGVQQGIVRQLQEAQHFGANRHTQVEMLVCIMADGLQYGNWPKED